MSEVRETNGRRYVVGVDGSEESRAALRWAAVEARRHGAELEVVHAWQPPIRLPAVSTIANPLIGTAQLYPGPQAARAQELLDRTLTDVFGGQPPSGVAAALREGPPAAVLIAESAQAELLVLGCRGFGGFKDLLVGSVCEQAVRHAHCSVIVVRRHEHHAATAAAPAPSPLHDRPGPASARGVGDLSDRYG
jgi:nucleotide-binding universal stress UspA family protein